MDPGCHIRYPRPLDLHKARSNNDVLIFCWAFERAYMVRSLASIYAQDLLNDNEGSNSQWSLAFIFLFAVVVKPLVEDIFS